MASQYVTVKNLITGESKQVRVRPLSEWASEQKTKLAERWDEENPGRADRNPWRN